MVSPRTPLVLEQQNPAEMVQCSNRFCESELDIETVVYFRGYGYCSKECKKEWPPLILRIQSDYQAPIAMVLDLAMKLFRSKAKASEVLGIGVSTLEKLLVRTRNK